ncbi:MAG: tRNA lysidine(34) synthetase TilS [Enterobacteriaceae bacterium]
MKSILFSKVLKHIYFNSSVVIAFSGGIDSTVLLDILSKIRDKKFKNISLRAFHINHGINKNSNNWEKHCSYQCYIRNIKLIKKKIILYKFPYGIECTLRKLRYDFFLKELKKNEILFLAHHQDDQAESMFLSLKRGQGSAGLSCMKEISNFGSIKIVRPFITCDKKLINRYANFFKIKWIEDDSNHDNRFDRNYLRNIIFPLIKKRWKNFSKYVNRSSKIYEEQEYVINHLIKERKNKFIYPDTSLNIFKIFFLDKFVGVSIIRFWSKDQNIFFSRKNLFYIWKKILLYKKNVKKNINIKFGLFQIKNFKNKLYIIKKNYCYPILNKKINWPINVNKINLPFNIGYVFKRSNFLENGICYNNYSIVRQPYKHENMFLRIGSIKYIFKYLNKEEIKLLKLIWNKKNLLPWEKEIIPFLFYNNKFISLIGVFVTKNGLPKSDENKSYIYFKY